ncbi:MAG: histidine phosphatase family protein [Eubacteriales bacterium]|nr:histidine phosphatase family protein [Eubacteriales bacterium]
MPPSNKMDQKFLQAPYYNLYLVRHGQSIGNYYHLFGGWMDLPLSEGGKQELAELKLEIPYPEADLHRHSGLTRAKHTLQIITGKEKEAEQDWRFSESYFGLREGSVPENYQINEDFFDKFYHDIPQGGGEELFSEQNARVLKACQDLLAELKSKNLNSAYIFGHYGTIKSALFAFSGNPAHNLESKEVIPNGSLWHFLFVDSSQQKSSRQSESLDSANFSTMGILADQDRVPGSEMRCLLIRSYWGQSYQEVDFVDPTFKEAASATLLS